MKVALVHDWLTGYRGGERVLGALCELYPEADVYTLVWDKGSVPDTIESHSIYTSLLQRMPYGVKRYKYYLPLLPVFAELISLDSYDLVISSSHAVVKNVRTPKGTLHVSYVHTPIRYLWDMFDEYFDRYFEESPKPFYAVARAFLKFAVKPWRWWDVRTAKRVDHFVTNSRFVAQRVKQFYGRDCVVIYPPVAVDDFIPQRKVRKQDYYVIVSALVPYKRVDLAVEAFNRSGRKLVVVGKGPEINRLQKLAKPNIIFTGFLEQKEMIKVLQEARGFIYPQVEDFGITAVEAQAAGTPVIAYAKGGVLETVIDGKTGSFFDQQTPEALNRALGEFEARSFDSRELIDNARRFGKERFSREFSGFISDVLAVAPQR